MEDHHDPLLESGLEELLGGVKPPELTEKILQKLSHNLSLNNQASGVNHLGEAVSTESGPQSPNNDILNRPADPVASSSHRVGSGFTNGGFEGQTATRKKRSTKIKWTITAAAICAVVMIVGFMISQLPLSNDPSTASKNNSSNSKTDTNKPNQSKLNSNKTKQPDPDSNQFNSNNPEHKIVNSNQNKEQNHSTTVPPKNNDTTNNNATKIVKQIPSDNSKTAANAIREDKIIAMINQNIHDGWQSAGIKPSARATDEEWCRRVHLAIIGRIPTIDELNRYLKNNQSNKRELLVDKLLNDEQYIEEYSRHFSGLWTNILIGRSGGTQPNSLTNRLALQQYLRRNFQRNIPYDRMVFELVNATGVNHSGTDQTNTAQFNGAVNYLTAKLEDNATQATAHTAQVFLGLQVQCTQCHHHPFNHWKQNQFWELNAFFRQTRSLRTFNAGSRTVKSVRLANEDFPGEGNTPSDAETYYELRNGLLKTAYPVFVDGTKISTSGYLEDVNRREALAYLMVQSDYLPRAMVNRLWEQFFGHGFTHPINDMGPHNPISHPELLETLAKQFKSHRFNVKSLIRWIALSDAYQLSSRMTAANKMDDPALGETPKFSHYYIRQMNPEQLYESLLVATQTENKESNYSQREMTKTRWLKQFTIAFNDNEGGEITLFNGSIPQSLMMLNGPLIRQATKTNNNGFLKQVIQSKTPSTTKINRLYLASIARTPTRSELRAASQLATIRNGKTTEVLEDVWWALLNSNEFILDH